MRLNSCICLLRSCIFSSINGLFIFFVHFCAGLFVLFFFISVRRILEDRKVILKKTFQNCELPEQWQNGIKVHDNPKNCQVSQHVWSVGKVKAGEMALEKWFVVHWAKLQRLTLCIIMGKLFLDAKVRLPVHKQYCGFIFRLWTTVCWLHGKEV